jgi:hypothetical protein
MRSLEAALPASYVSTLTEHFHDLDSDAKGELPRAHITPHHITSHHITSHHLTSPHITS